MRVAIAVAALTCWAKDGAVVTEKPPRIVLVDDLRSFVDGRVAQVARTSTAGIEALERHRGQRLDELWLDHDLGGDDTIWPVVEVLERAAFEERPFDIGVVYVHSANPAGLAKILQALRRWGYQVRSAAGSPHVGYLSEAE
ncbi:hypothetical protein FHX75_12867 [Micromonospora palomenae]|uniref:Cyclic-phosphate processing Receiver domain-containing protein n=1 Tax=Micromonospora palomenae TaxID=1461247 RepID=A0A561WEP2_9ACTN|nr:hypothetical protein FHX75_12867 [Micromonospora palomenae]